MSYTSNRHDSFMALIIGATIALVIWGIMWAIVNVNRDDERRDVDIVNTCQQAENPEVCQALS